MFSINKMLNTTKNVLLAWNKNYIRSLYTSKIVYSKSDDTPSFDMNNPFKQEKKKCILCAMNIIPDYKNIKLLSQFQSPHTGNIYGRHITGLCKMQQGRVELEIRKAQNAGMMATYLKEVEFLNDPKLFDPNKPIRPHRF